MSNRRYGYFRCSSCNSTWESAQVHLRNRGPDGKYVYYMQDCRNCGEACQPYRAEKLHAPAGRRHVDSSKNHPKELCHKCKSGRPCKNSY